MTQLQQKYKELIELYEEWRDKNIPIKQYKEILILQDKIAELEAKEEYKDGDTDEKIKQFAIKMYGKDDLSPIERNVLDDYIRIYPSSKEATPIEELFKG